MSGERVQRRSTGFSEFMKWLAREEGLRVLDLGATSPANITFFIGLGHRFHQEDVLRLASDKSLIVTNGEGQKTIDVDRFLRENLSLERQEFDAVMFWDLADYLPEPLVKPVIERIHVAMKPSAILFSFFHTKDAGPEAPFYRYNIASKDTLEMQPASPYQAATNLQQPPCRESVPRFQLDQVLSGPGQHSRSAGDSVSRHLRLRAASCE